jgi:hypothetical protein
VRAAFAALAALAVAGCATVRVSSTDPAASIYVDRRLAGQGHAELQRMGPPRTARIEVETADGRRATTTVSRAFVVETALLAIPTFGLCLLSCWLFEDDVVVPLPPRDASSWDAVPGNDPWLRPPPEAAPQPARPADP